MRILEYAIFGFLLYVAFSPQTRRGQLKTPFFSIIIGIFYGISDEAHQYFVQGREADPLDAVIDAVGIVAAPLFLHLERKKPQIELDVRRNVEANAKDKKNPKNGK